MADMNPLPLYPLPTRASLLSQYTGHELKDIPTPAVVLDRAIIRRNCDAMLSICEELRVGFRAHVKSHKTLELSKMQVGERGPANFIVSTIAEAENLLPFLCDAQGVGREASVSFISLFSDCSAMSRLFVVAIHSWITNSQLTCASKVLYGVPVPQSGIPRLISLASKLQLRSVNVIIDNEAAFHKFHEQLAVCETKVEIGIFIKIDTGYERAGIKTSSPAFPSLVKAVVEKSQETESRCFLQGFYSHFGHSYAGSSEDDAANGLIEELVGLEAAIKAVPESFDGKLVLSVGATPTATAAQNMLSSSSPKVEKFQDVLRRLQKDHVVELHAGVYPLLDCQQVATHARPPTSSTGAASSFQPLAKSNIGIRMLVEVTSVYDERSKPEALVSAGSLAMGREPCKSYPGWGIVTPALGNASAKHIYDEREGKTGWIVGRISQEHGILTWEGEKSECNELTIGDKVMVWPNHACVAGAGFGWYLVVDSESEGDRVVDVWVRWRGW
jgi:D-serine deaminase-like pyridoxal phosphate-dependent protein